MMRRIENGRVESTHLGPEDHGIFSAYIALKYDAGELALKYCCQWGLRSITRATIIVRDPNNDEMYVVTTNEPDDAALAHAVRIAAPVTTEVQDG